MSFNSFSSGFSPWQEDVIYFLLVDRFHDGKKRTTSSSSKKSKGFGNCEQLQRNCGGNLKGVIQKLDYIKSLGCTAVWLSPVFENNPESYHGYAIQNFLKVDPRFGTEEDLVNLVATAHGVGLKVFLDAVINHTGNNWSYKEKKEAFYQRGKTYEFGEWRSEDLPQPVSLRNPDYYFRKGMVRNWDAYPETRQGDFFSLKKFRLDESDKGLEVQKILADIYKYWIRVTDCDGFRIDAAKHAGEQAVSRFCTNMKEYAESIGKNDFFLFAEIPAMDKFSFSFFNTYLSEKEEKYYHGPDSILDFPLHFLLKKIIKGQEKPERLRQRFSSIENLTLSKKRTLVTFLDNHDQIEGPSKKRIASELSYPQLLAALGLLFTFPGIPCLYYGTEQLLSGEGTSDSCIREAMFEFEKEEGVDLFQTASPVYKEISKMLAIRKQIPELTSGILTWPKIKLIGDSLSQPEPLVFMRESEEEQTLICFNSSNNEKQEFFVEIKYDDQLKDRLPSIWYTNLPEGHLNVEKFGQSKNGFKIVLSPEQFIILK